VLKTATLLSRLNLLIDIFYLDLGNKDLQNTVKLYEEFGNVFREKYRGERHRPSAQILYSHLLEHTLFSSISHFLELNQISSKFSVFIDNWAIPSCDTNIILKDTSKLITQKNNEICHQFFPGVSTICDDIELLVNDSSRKRFIDVLTSVVSRNFLEDVNPKYFKSIEQILTPNQKFDISNLDITKTTVDTILTIMDSISRRG